MDDPARMIAEGRVLVDGRVTLNPNSQVRRGAAISVQRPAPLRGEAKLRAALEAFPVVVAGRRPCVQRGARRVYAVDVGHGQLIGSLRQDARVTNLEGTNLSGLGPSLVPDPIGLFTLDLSYLSLAAAVPYLARVETTAGAALLALVKPMFELGLPQPPAAEAELEGACALAERAIAAAGWSVLGRVRSPVLGARGAVEFWIHAGRGWAGP